MPQADGAQQAIPDGMHGFDQEDGKYKPVI
jgi:hypothetical protein